MDLNLTPQQQQFRDEFRAWLESNIPEDWQAYESRDEESSRERFDFLRAWQKKMFEAGWVGIHWPKEYGGRGVTIIEQAVFIEEMARAQAPPLINVLGLSLLGPTLINYGTEAQKQRFLSNILSADEIWCQGYSEPNAGSDLAALRSEAVLDGDHFIVNGQKTWTSFGHYADFCFAVVRTDPDAPKHKGLTYMLIDMHSPGVRLRPLKQMTGESEAGDIGAGGDTDLAEDLGRRAVRHEHRLHKTVEPFGAAHATHPSGQEGTGAQRFREDEQVAGP